MGLNIIINQFLIGISTGLVFFLAAAGMAIVISGMGIINFAQGVFYMFGTFICYTVASWTGSFWLAIIAAPLVVGIGLGWATERLLRPIYKSPPYVSTVDDYGRRLCRAGPDAFHMGQENNFSRPAQDTHLQHRYYGHEIPGVLPFPYRTESSYKPGHDIRI